MELFGTTLPSGQIRYSDPWRDEINDRRAQQASLWGLGLLGINVPFKGLLAGAHKVEDKYGRPRSKSTLVKQGFEPVTTSVPAGTAAGQTLYRLSNRPPTPEDVAHNEKYGMRVTGNLPDWLGGGAIGQGVQTGRRETQEQRDDSPIIAKERKRLWKLYQRLGRMADLAAYKAHVRQYA